MKAALVTPFTGHLPLGPGSFLGYGHALLECAFEVETIDFNALAFWQYATRVVKVLTEIETAPVASDGIHLTPLMGTLTASAHQRMRATPWEEYAAVYITMPSWFVTVPTQAVVSLSRIIRRRATKIPIFFFGTSLGTWTDGAILRKEGVDLRHINDLFHGGHLAESVDFDSLPNPIYPNLDRYLLPILPFRLKHGCSWGRCRFCSLSKGGNAGYRERSAKGVMGELGRLIATYRPRLLVCQDNTLNARDMIMWCHTLEALQMRWVGMARVGLTVEEIRALGRAGCQAIYFGLESGSDRILQRIDKGITSRQASRFIRSLWDEGIAPVPSMGVGWAEEHECDFEASLRFIDDHAAYLGMVNIYPFMVTPASTHALHGCIPHPDGNSRLFRLIAHCCDIGLKVCVGSQTGEYMFIRSAYEECTVGEETLPSP